MSDWLNFLLAIIGIAAALRFFQACRVLDEINRTLGVMHYDLSDVRNRINAMQADSKETESSKHG